MLAEVKSRVSWSELQELAGAYVEAKEAHKQLQMYNVNADISIDARIEFGR